VVALQLCWKGTLILRRDKQMRMKFFAMIALKHNAKMG